MRDINLYRRYMAAIQVVEDSATLRKLREKLNLREELSVIEKQFLSEAVEKKVQKFLHTEEIVNLLEDFLVEETNNSVSFDELSVDGQLYCVTGTRDYKEILKEIKNDLNAD